MLLLLSPPTWRHGRIRFATIFPVLSVALLSCADGKGLDDFDITRTANTVIAGSILTQVLAPLGFSSLSDMNLSESAEMKNSGAKANQIDSIHLTLLRLKVKKPPTGQDLTFFSTVKFYAESKGLPKVLVAEGGPFAAGTAQVDLKLTGAELKAYATAPAMSLTTEVTGHPPAQDTTIEATVSLRVNVNVSGTVLGN